MKLKTLLLSSATVFVMAGGAQAADPLWIEDPVDYVRVCDAFGNGYHYIPGTDTCLKIGGFVDVELEFMPSENIVPTGEHYAGWSVDTEFGMTFTAKSMTDYGVLTSFADFRGVSDNQSGTNIIPGPPGPFTDDRSGSKRLTLSRTYLELGALMTGYNFTTFNYRGSLSGLVLQSNADAYTAFVTIDQVRLTWAMGGYGLMLALEDPRDRWGSDLPLVGVTPDIIGAITARRATWDGQVSLGVSQLADGTVWGALAGATIKMDSINPGDQLRLQGAVGTGAAYVASFYKFLLATNYVTNWTAFASYKHNWAPGWSSAFTYSYLNNGGGNNRWAVGHATTWSPATNFSVRAGVMYTQREGADPAMAGQIRIRRDFGSR